MNKRDRADDAIAAFEARKREMVQMVHHASCTPTDAPKLTDDWSLVDCPICLRSDNNPHRKTA